MKTRKTIHQISNTINMNQLDVSNLYFLKIVSLLIWLAVVMIISLGFVTKPVRAESTGTENVHQGYRYIKPKGVENTAGSASQSTKESSAAKVTNAKDSASGDQNSQTEPVSKPAGVENTAGSASQSTKESSAAKVTNAKDSTSGDQNSQTEPVSKPADGKGLFPTFAEADVNGDHYITKDELKNYPDLLQVFDKVDAGKDGKLEQHEFENLEMETKREGGIQ